MLRNVLFCVSQERGGLVDLRGMDSGSAAMKRLRAVSFGGQGWQQANHGIMVGSGWTANVDLDGPNCRNIGHAGGSRLIGRFRPVQSTDTWVSKGAL